MALTIKQLLSMKKCLPRRNIDLSQLCPGGTFFQALYVYIDIPLENTY